MLGLCSNGSDCDAARGIHQVAFGSVQVTPVRLNVAAQHHWRVDSAFQHKIRLITGRTHQIRAQLAAVAAPLLGDHLYSTLLANGVFSKVPANSTPDDDGKNFAHRELHVSSQAQGSATCMHDANKWIDAYREGARHERPLGLQANQLTVDHTPCMGAPPMTFSAGTPWWM